MTTTMKKKVTLLMVMLTRVGMRMVTRMVVRMVMAARMLVKTVTMMVMLTTARGLIMLMLAVMVMKGGRGLLTKWTSLTSSEHGGAVPSLP